MTSPPKFQWAIVSVVATLAILSGVSVYLIGTEALLEGASKFEPAMLAVLVLLALWNIACRFLRWYLFLRTLTLRLPAPEALLYYVAGMSMSLTPGRIGEALRLWFLERRLGAPYRRIAGLYLADRGGDAMAYLVLIAAGSTALATSLPIAWGAPLLVLAGVVVLMKPRLLINALTWTYARVGAGRRLLLWVRRALRNTEKLFQPRVFLPALALGTMAWLATPAVLYLSLARLGAEVDPLLPVSVAATASLAGGATNLPGGGGATELVMIALLRASGVPLEASVPAVFVTRLAISFLPIALGLLALPAAMRLAGRRA